MKNVLIQVDGNLVYDPQLRQVGLKNVCNFTVAANVGSKREDGTYNSNFFECSSWGKGGEWLFSKMQKGTGVTVLGTLEQAETTNPTTGEKRTKMRITAISVKLRSNLRNAENPADVEKEVVSDTPGNEEDETE